MPRLIFSLIAPLLTVCVFITSGSAVYAEELVNATYQWGLELLQNHKRRVLTLMTQPAGIAPAKSSAITE